MALGAEPGKLLNLNMFPLAAILGLTAIIGAMAIFTQWYLDGRNFFVDILERRRLARYSVTEWDELQFRSGNRSDIIISLTTIPERLDMITPTLISLLAQSRQAARILLWLPEKSIRSGAQYVVPSWLAELKSVEIRRCEDKGPATKFLFALRELPPDTRVLVVDDDKIYPYTFLEQMEKQADLFPEYALGCSGWRVPEDLTDRPTTLWRNICRQPPAPVKSPWVKKIYPIDILQGYSGYLIKPRFFNLEKLWNYRDAPEAAFFVDDVWVSAHCKAEKFVIPGRRFCMEPTGHRRLYSLTSLGRVNRGNGNPNHRNNTIMMRYFEKVWGA